MSDSIIPPDEMKNARAEALKHFETILQLAVRRAANPSGRVALSEIEQEFLNVRTQWKDRGLLPDKAA